MPSPVQSVSCPRCYAQRGEPCRNLRRFSESIRATHAERRIRARRADSQRVPLDVISLLEDVRDMIPSHEAGCPAELYGPCDCTEGSLHARINEVLAR